METSRQKKLCLISSSGGHYEQLRMLMPLALQYRICWVTEATAYAAPADYYLIQTGSKDRWHLFKMIRNLFRSCRIWAIERPDFVITTGTMVAIPMIFLSRLFRKKLIYIESFARTQGGTKTGRLAYKYADLFIVQWESLKTVYPNAVYGGSIY
jgi:UDP-N-acetylglucosamine:LPS N-acetylglucosamine transferase